MEKYITFIKDGRLIMQESEYIEDGFYIEVIGSQITLYEIPLHAGKDQEIGRFETIIEAIEHSKKLT